MTTSPSQAMSATDLARNWGDEDQVVDGATGAHRVRYSFTAERFGHMLDAFAAALSAQGAAPAESEDALHLIMRMADAAKEPCGMDPESPAAIRNGKFASIAQVAAQGLGLVRGPALSQQAPAAPAEAPLSGLPMLFAGLLYDFGGFLTSRDERLTVSGHDNAGPMVEAIVAFAEKRGLSLDDPATASWHVLIAAEDDDAEQVRGHDLMNHLVDMAIESDLREVTPAEPVQQDTKGDAS